MKSHWHQLEQILELQELHNEWLDHWLGIPEQTSLPSVKLALSKSYLSGP